MKRGRKAKFGDESEVRETLVENEVVSNKLFDDADNDDINNYGEDEDLNDLLRKLDNITNTFSEENENPFYYFLNMYNN